MAKFNYEGKFQMKGNAYICIYNFNERFVKNECFVPDCLKEKYKGGFGAVIYADFKKPAGTAEKEDFQEVIFIPGKFDFDGEERYIATRCYVSSQNVIDDDGYGLLGPKTPGKFHITTVDDGITHLSVHEGRNRVLTVELDAWDMLSIKASTSFIAFPFSQLTADGERIDWDYNGKATLRMASLQSAQVRPAFFPDIVKFSPIVSLCLTDFTLALNGDKKSKNK